MVMTTVEAGRRRWKGTTIKQRKEIAAKAAGSFWAKLNPEQRSAEMKRRVKVRERNKARKAKRANKKPAPRS
jgi:hypothetical protein